MAIKRLTIDKLGGGAVGLAHADTGQVVMIPYVLPGEEVTVRIRRRKKDYLEGELVEVLKPHPGRMSPLCPHFGPCGGCDLQQAAYHLQVELKQQIMLEQLERAGVLSGGAGELLEEPLASQNPYAYRQRLRLQVDESGRWGFFRRRSHQLEVIEDCPLARPEISAVLRNFRSSRNLMHLIGLSRELEVVFSPGDGSFILLHILRRKPRSADLRAASEVVGELPMVKSVFLEAEGYSRQGPFPAKAAAQENIDPGMVWLDFPARDAFRLPAYNLSYEAGGFSQVNPEQNQGMIDTMLEWLAGENIRRAADLFCGLGNFSIPLALTGIAVAGADLQRSAIRSANRNAASLGLVNCSFIQASAEAGLRQLLDAGEEFDLVILDPPRRGCPEVLPLLSDLAAPYLLYISCDPATLARDLSGLAGQGYGIKKLRMVDMFPQTAHLETMVLLSRSGQDSQ